MKCPSCNKFAAYDTSATPEVELSECVVEEVDDGVYSAAVNGDAKIVLTSECCSEELKEYTFGIENFSIDVSKAADCKCTGDAWHMDAFWAVDGAEITDRKPSTKLFTFKRGPRAGETVEKPVAPRYQVQYYGVSVDIEVTCGCGKVIGTGVFTDEVPASGMDELV